MAEQSVPEAVVLDIRKSISDVLAARSHCYVSILLTDGLGLSAPLLYVVNAAVASVWSQALASQADELTEERAINRRQEAEIELLNAELRRWTTGDTGSGSLTVCVHPSPPAPTFGAGMQVGYDIGRRRRD